MQFSRLPLGIAMIAVIHLAVVTTIPVKNGGELDRVKRAGWSWPWSSEDVEQNLKPTQPENSTSAVVNTTTVDAMTILDALNNAASLPSSSSPSVSTTKLAETSEQIIAISGNKAENSKDNFAENISKTEFLTVAEKPTEMMEDDVNAAHKEPEKAEEVVTGNELSSGFKLKTTPTEIVTELPTAWTMDSVTEDLGSINTTEVSGPIEEGSKDEDFDESKGDTIPSSTLEERSDTLSEPTTTQATDRSKGEDLAQIKEMQFMKEMPLVKPSQEENTTASKTHLTTTEHEDFPTTPPIVKSGSDASEISDKFDEESKSDDEYLNPFQSDIDMMKVTNVSMDSGDSDSVAEKELEIAKDEGDAARTQISISRVKDFQTVPTTPKANEKLSTAPPTEESKIEAEIAKLDSFSDEIAASKRKIEGEAMINGIFAKIDKQLNEIPTEEPNGTTKTFHDANKIVISSTGTKVRVPVKSLMEELERVSTTGPTTEFFHKEDVDPTEIYEWEKMSENASVESNLGIMNMGPEMIPTTLTPVIAVLVDVASDQGKEDAGKEDAFEPAEVEASIQKDVGVGLEAVYNHDKMNIEEPMLTTLPPDSTTVFEETKAQRNVNDLENDEKLLPAASEPEPEVAVTTLPPKSADSTATADASTNIDEKAEETEAGVPLDKDSDLHAELAARELEPASQDKIIEPIMLTTEIEESNANAIKNLPTSVVRTTLRSGVYAADTDMSPVVEEIVAADETEIVDKAIKQDPAAETSVEEVKQTTKSPEGVGTPAAGLKEHVEASAVELDRNESTAAVEKYQAANDFPKTTRTTTTLAIKEASAIPEDEIGDNQDASSVSLDDSVEEHMMTEPKIVETTDKTGQMSKPVEDKNPDPVAKEGNEKVDDESATTKPRRPSLTPEESAEDVEDGTGNGPVEESMKDVTEEDELESKDVPKEDAVDEKNDEISEDEKPVPKRTMMDDAKVAEVVEMVDLQKKTTKERTEFMFPKEEVPDDSASRAEHDERIPMMVGLGVGSGICVLIVVFTVACIRRKRAQGEHELVPQTEPL